MQKAKIFWSGRFQAVRLSKDFRVETDEVKITRKGNAVILEPVAEGEWAWLDKLVGELDEHFVAAASEDMPMQERPDLEKLFR